MTKFIEGQYRRPTGFVGLMIGKRMARQEVGLLSVFKN
jgi:hypothetical protein